MQYEFDINPDYAILPYEYFGIWKIFKAHADAKLPDSTKNELSYVHMLVLRKLFSDRAMKDESLSDEQSAILLGYTKQLQNACEEVGPDWDPSEPSQLGAWGLLARKVLDEHYLPVRKPSEKDYIIVPYALKDLFLRKLPRGLPDHVHKELSYEEMLCLAALYREWSEDEDRYNSWKRTQCFMRAWHLERLADYLGPDWKALSPRKFSAWGDLAEEAVELYGDEI